MDKYLWGETEEDFGPSFHESGLEQVRNWIRKQRFVPCNLSDEFLQRFLDVSGEDVGRATKMIWKYFYIRQEPGPIFRDRNPTSPINQSLFGLLYAVPLRNLLKDGEIILLTGLLKPTKTFSAIGHLKLLALTLDYLLWDKMNKFTDLKIFVNGQNFLCPALLDNSYGDIDSHAKKFQKSFPVKFRGVYIYRPPEHVKEIARIYNGLWVNTIYTPEEVASKFPASILPFEFGGTLGHLKELLDEWNFQSKLRSKFLVQFERRMTNDYRRRMCHEREVREGGKNWIWNLKLVADESEYKKRYYERMANMKPMHHPAFGEYRLKNKRNEPRTFDPMKKIRLLVQESENIFLEMADGKISAGRDLPSPPVSCNAGSADEQNEKKVEFVLLPIFFHGGLK